MANVYTGNGKEEKVFNYTGDGKKDGMLKYDDIVSEPGFISKEVFDKIKNGEERFSVLSDLESPKNNGGKTDYYQLDSCEFKINDFDDFAEWRKMNGNQFNIGKVVWTFNQGRHDGTNYERDLNKIIHYANRELKRIGRDNV